ncbi:kinesin-like protein KIF27 isoform X2 [Argonauta hians]
MQEINVKVAVRVRPLLNRERLNGDKRCVRVFPSTNQIVLGTDKGFTFDYVHSAHSTQEDVYQSVEPLVDSIFEGYNATVFAYGQTGSGKTYTIGGFNLSSMPVEQQGIIPRAVHQVYDVINSKTNIQFTVRVSYVEVYLEELCDLLDVDNKTLHVREDEKGNTVISGVQEVKCESMEDVIACLENGSAVRHTGLTQMNEHSSRSHSVFTIVIEISHCMSAKFHFVDLAGSERAHRIGNVGERFKESVHINTGLLALGNVISSLADSKKKTKHIPYRDSKITRILKDSLGGNAQTLMICCISPAESGFDETLNSLKYANRVKDIRNKPIINRDMQSIKFEKMQTEILNLREELARQQSRVFSSGDAISNSEGDKDGITTPCNNIKELEEKVVSLQTECHHYQQLSDEAYKQMLQMQEQDILSKSQNLFVNNWINLRDQIMKNVTSSVNIAESWNRHKIEELEADIKKCQEQLSSDEEIFIQMTKENNSLKERLKEMAKCLSEKDRNLADCQEKVKQQKQQLLEQQIQIDEMRNSLKTPVKREDIQTIERLHVRPQTVPIQHDNVTYLRPPSRQIHTSPALFSLERIMQNFRARSQLLVVHLEDSDEVLQVSFDTEQERCSPTLQDRPSTYKKSHSDLKRQLTFKKARTAQQRDNRDLCCDQDPMGSETSIELLELSSGQTGHPLSPSSSIEDEQLTHMNEMEVKMAESNQKLSNLALNIRMKEQFIRELVKKGKDASLLNKQYSQKIKEQEKEMVKLQRDLGETKRNLQELEGQGGHTEETDQKRIYLKKIEDAEQKISVLMKQQKETVKVANITSHNDKKIEDLKLSVLKMKQQHDNLQRKLKEEYEKKSKLERVMQREKMRVRKLEQCNQKQQIILKRKNEEIATAHRKLRGASSLPRINGGHQDSLDEKKRQLDIEEEKILDQRQQLEELQKELQRKEDIISNREAMLAEKSELKMKKLRSSQILNKNLTGLSAKLMTVEKTIESKKMEMFRASQDQEESVAREIEKLKQVRSNLRQQLATLEEKLTDGCVLSNQEERRLIELEEAVEELEAAIEYKNKTIESRQMELRQSWFSVQREGGILSLFDTLSQPEMKLLLMKYFEKVITFRDKERKLTHKVNEFEGRLEEQEKLFHEAESHRVRASFDIDRRLTQQQQKYEQKIGVLMHQLAQFSQNNNEESDKKEPDLKIQNLEKELYYYKKTSRELKKKLRDKESKSLYQSEDLGPKISMSKEFPRYKSSITSRDSLVNVLSDSQTNQEVSNQLPELSSPTLKSSQSGSRPAVASSLQFIDSLEIRSSH